MAPIYPVVKFYKDPGTLPSGVIQSGAESGSTIVAVGQSPFLNSSSVVSAVVFSSDNIVDIQCDAAAGGVVAITTNATLENNTKIIWQGLPSNGVVNGVFSDIGLSIGDTAGGLALIAVFPTKLVLSIVENTVPLNAVVTFHFRVNGSLVATYETLSVATQSGGVDSYYVLDNFVVPNNSTVSYSYVEQDGTIHFESPPASTIVSATRIVQTPGGFAGNDGCGGYDANDLRVVNSTTHTAPTVAWNEAVSTSSNALVVNVTGLLLNEWATSIVLNISTLDRVTNFSVVYPLNLATNIAGIGSEVLTISIPYPTVKPNITYSTSGVMANDFALTLDSFAGTPPAGVFFPPGLIQPPVGIPPPALQILPDFIPGYNTSTNSPPVLGSFPAPAQNPPTDVVVSDISYNTATVSWNAGVQLSSPWQTTAFQVWGIQGSSSRLLATTPYVTGTTSYSASVSELLAGTATILAIYPIHLGSLPYPAGAVTTSSIFNTLVRISPPTDLSNNTVIGNTVVLTWNAPATLPTPPITSYILTRTNPDGSIVKYNIPGLDDTGNPVLVFAFTVTNLTEGGDTVFSLVAKNSLYTSTSVGLVVGVPIVAVPTITSVTGTNTLVWTVSGLTAPATPGTQNQQFVNVLDPETGATVMVVNAPYTGANAPFTADVSVAGFIRTGTWWVTTTTIIDTVSVTSDNWIVQYVPPQPNLAPPQNVRLSFLPVEPPPSPGSFVSDYASVVIQWDSSTLTIQPPVQRYYIYQGTPDFPTAPIAIVSGVDGGGLPIASFTYQHNNIPGFSPPTSVDYPYYIVADNDVYESPPSELKNIQIPAGWGDARNTILTTIEYATNTWVLDGYYSNAGVSQSLKVYVVNDATQAQHIFPFGGGWLPLEFSVTLDVSPFIAPGKWLIYAISTVSGLPWYSPYFVVYR